MKYRFDRATNSPDLVSEPQFDDERTLLSARRVVPLEKINAKVRHRRHWFIGGAFAVAMMLGAASALLASYLKMRNVQNAPVAVTQVDVPEESPVAVSENPPAETPVAAVAVPSPEVSPEMTATAESTPEESTPKPAPVKRRSVVVAATKPDDYMSDPSETRQMSEQDALHQIRDNVLYDEWQERRARRVWRRERRRADRYNNHRDLSNLDEIFEGRKRPNP
ncbi:MAG TPA: hypothetical protein VGP98_00055 [Pyrinomonadaceae bacterium]|jgi:hypothetical protein|nr:hypothetical protein [Pyrinomonadaceae bacterium]